MGKFYAISEVRDILNVWLAILCDLALKLLLHRLDLPLPTYIKERDGFSHAYFLYLISQDLYYLRAIKLGGIEHIANFILSLEFSNTIWSDFFIDLKFYQNFDNLNHFKIG